MKISKELGEGVADLLLMWDILVGGLVSSSMYTLTIRERRGLRPLVYVYGKTAASSF